MQVHSSIGARLALGIAGLLGLSMALTSAVLYYGTIGVLDQGINAKIVAIADRLMDIERRSGRDALIREIRREFNDGVDSDTEIFLLTNHEGQRLVGNLSAWLGSEAVPEKLLDQDVVRDGRAVLARLYIRKLSDGGRLYVGRDLGEQQSIRTLVLRALAFSGCISLFAAGAGGLYFRHRVESRISEIRQTAKRIEDGHLKSRIAVTGRDEFARLSEDLNRMLDRIEHLVEGVRHVSNAVAHDLRTPLARLRNRLEEAVTRDSSSDELKQAAQVAIHDTDAVIGIFNKLLLIAEAESGLRAEAFEPVDLNQVVHDLAELYGASAELAQIHLAVLSHAPVWCRGDHDLLANALASLLDNAIKYAGRGRKVELGAYLTEQGCAVVVRDNGPGVSPTDLTRLTERFYRVDRARHESGNGLGLSIVSAIAVMHQGVLQVEDASPGLRVSFCLPGLGGASVSRDATASLEEPVAIENSSSIDA